MAVWLPVEFTRLDNSEPILGGERSDALRMGRLRASWGPRPRWLLRGDGPQHGARCAVARCAGH